MLHDVDKGVLMLGCTKGTVCSPYHKTNLLTKFVDAHILAFLVDCLVLWSLRVSQSTVCGDALSIAKAQLCV
jgi:hypothetical protein